MCYYATGLLLACAKSTAPAKAYINAYLIGSDSCGRCGLWSVVQVKVLGPRGGNPWADPVFGRLFAAEMSLFTMAKVGSFMVSERASVSLSMRYTP